MSINDAAKGAIGAYLAMSKPGYALLIDAPWGAGKTHFVREVCDVDTNHQKVRYASLNGVSDAVAFRRALLKESLDVETANRLSGMANAFARVFKMGDLGSLTRDYLEERMISELPETLIFDDLERATLPPAEVLGLINDFVEHQQKRVILLVHSGEHPEQEPFLQRREKLVGRTIRVLPDFDAAFPKFLEHVPEGRGKAYLTDHQAIVKEVFDQADHGNLRLLRNSVRDCAHLLDAVENERFSAQEAMSRFVRTYLSISMALARSEISSDQLPHRGSGVVVGSGEGNEEFQNLRLLCERHKGADIFAHSGSAFPMSLDEPLFVNGYIDPGQLEAILQATRQFDPQEENPLWKVAVHWGDMGWDEIGALIEQINKYVFEMTSIEPGPYLHLADTALRLQEYGALAEDRIALTNRILQRIEELHSQGHIPPAKFGTQLGWGLRGKHFSFGGYACDANDEFYKIIDVMKTAQIEGYEASLPEITSRLLQAFEENISQVYLSFSYVNDEDTFYGVPILHLLDVKRFAEISMNHLKTGNAQELCQFFRKLSDRHGSDSKWDDERKWALQVRQEMIRIAEEIGPIAKGHLQLTLSFCWKFLEPADIGESAPTKEQEE
ncbi:hypothetical protein SM764_17005 [Pseudophaeobacter sp. 1A16562]|uniref:P-loop NTPase fold protein n=1 Tax=Pseudophaeobacter sp. 1A16562 TaxID=3098143 RepID=UPI0034D527D4